MMDSPIVFLLDNLKQLIMYHVDLISGADDELKHLVSELGTLNALLRDAATMRKKDQSFRKWESDVRELVYDVKDTIDACIIKEVNRSIFSADTFKLARIVRSMRDKIKPLVDINRIGLARANLGGTDAATSTPDKTTTIRQQRRESNIVGLEDEAKKLIGYLKDESSHGLGVVSIVGMPGLGKTTAAWKVFKDPDIVYQFGTRIWVNITEDADMRNMLLTIQGEFEKATPNLNDAELGERVKVLLKDRKFLIVMDDVWTDTTWNRIKNYLPMSNKRGRVLITSRQSNVAGQAKHHMLKFLSAEESWDLLQLEVSGMRGGVDEELVQVGRIIANHCDGLPLSIVVIGGILAHKTSKKDWENVSESINLILLHHDQDKRLENIISLSYAKMPYELQSCFLYLGVFPEDAEISAKKLTLLWIAEGMIQEIQGKSFEETARDNLNELIYRNLVMVDKTNHSGEAKICRVHDTIREFCKTEAASYNQNLYTEPVYRSPGVFQPPLESNEAPCRRLCIHSHVYEFLSRKPSLSVPKAHSFLSFPKGNLRLEKEEVQHLIDSFSVIRVYDAEKIKFPRFPPNIRKLFFLRYLTLSIASDRFKALPKVIYELKNLQTFLLETASRTIKITADVWKLVQMRHFKTNASIVMKNGGAGDGGEHLQTLSRLSPESCTDAVLKKARNLIMLGIQGDLSTITEFQCLEKLARLYKLKLVHDVHNSTGAENPWSQLPEASKFPSNLKFLVLEGTCLKWENIFILGSLSFLEILKLKENAFKGDKWNARGGGFFRLEHLHIERADLISWTATPDAFPELKTLHLQNCHKLMDVPTVLVDKLEKLSMERVTPTAVSSARKHKRQQQESGSSRKRKRMEDLILEIAPTDN